MQDTKQKPIVDFLWPVEQCLSTIKACLNPPELERWTPLVTSQVLIGMVAIGRAIGDKLLPPGSEVR